MNLSEYIKVERGRAASLAAAIGVHPVMVSQWAGLIKPVPMDRCTPVELATDGAVRRWDLRPSDWHMHWPELVGTKGAPPVPAAEPAPAQA